MIRIANPDFKQGNQQATIQPRPNRSVISPESRLATATTHQGLGRDELIRFGAIPPNAPSNEPPRPLSRSQLKELIEERFQRSGLWYELKRNGVQPPFEQHPILQAFWKCKPQPAAFYVTVMQDSASMLGHLSHLLKEYDYHAFKEEDYITSRAKVAAQRKKIITVANEVLPAIITSVSGEKQWKHVYYNFNSALYRPGNKPIHPAAVPQELDNGLEAARILQKAVQLKKPKYWNLVNHLIREMPLRAFLLYEFPLNPADAATIPEARWKRFREMFDLIKAEGPPQGVGTGKRMAIKLSKLFDKSNQDQLNHYSSLRMLVSYVGMPVTEERWHAETERLLSQIRAGDKPFQAIGRQMATWMQELKLMPQVNPNNSPLTSRQVKKFIKGFNARHGEALSFARQKGNLAHGRLYLDMLQGKDAAKEKAWIQMIPHLLFTYPPGAMESLLSKLEVEMEKKRYPANHHPNEAEIMLMLRHPKDPQRERVGPTILALTSIFGFLKTRKVDEVTDSAVKNWSDIGFLTHTFRSWKYDAQGGKESLLGQFGFRPAKPRANDTRFGKGYLLRRDGFMLEFRRAYLLASHPTFGTLVIRNSSPEFGRDTMSHPAYWRPDDIGENALDRLDPDHDTRFKHVMSPELYFSPEDAAMAKRSWLANKLLPLSASERQRLTEVPTPTEAMRPLLDTILKVKDEYRRWKFDTEAFEGDNFLGHLSPGFKPMIESLRFWNLMHSLAVENRKPPALAFVHPNYPPWESYPYPGSDERFPDRVTSQERFELTPTHLEEIAAYFERSWPPERLLQSDWYQFLQSGIHNRAELVMLDAVDNGPVRFLKTD